MVKEGNHVFETERKISFFKNVKNTATSSHLGTGGARGSGAFGLCAACLRFGRKKIASGGKIRLRRLQLEGMRSSTYLHSTMLDEPSGATRSLSKCVELSLPLDETADTPSCWREKTRPKHETGGNLSLIGSAVNYAHRLTSTLKPPVVNILHLVGHDFQGLVAQQLAFGKAAAHLADVLLGNLARVDGLLHPPGLGNGPEGYERVSVSVCVCVHKSVKV